MNLESLKQRQNYCILNWQYDKNAYECIGGYWHLPLRTAATETAALRAAATKTTAKEIGGYWHPPLRKLGAIGTCR